MEMQFEGRSFVNNPVIYVAHPNIRSLIPLTLRYTTALRAHPMDIEGKILEFHRIEPSTAFTKKKNKKIYFCHGNIEVLSSEKVDAKWRGLSWLYFLLERRLIEKIDRTFVVNEAGLAFYRRRYAHISGRFHFLPTYVDDQIFYPLSYHKRSQTRSLFLHQYQLSPDSSLLLFAGRLELPKDPFLLLNTFRLILQRLEHTKLLIIGEGSLKTQMEKNLREYGIADRVHFLGALPQKKLAEIMQISDLFMLTSSFEGMPISALESLACGLPVVTTDVGGVRQFIIDGCSGFIASQRLPEHIACTAARILTGERNIEPSNCVRAVAPYFAKNVLQPLYDYHLEIIDESPE